MFDPSTATTFDNENSNFVSFNSELDSAVTQYLSQVSEIGYRPTSGGSSLSTFKADLNNSNNSVASVNSRTSERLLAVQFQLDPSKHHFGGPAHSEPGVGDDETATEDVTEKTGSEGSSTVDTATYSNSSDDSSVQENFYENGSIAVIDEPIYENVDGSLDDVFDTEPLYDTVPRRPQVPPKPEILARTDSQDNAINLSDSDYPQKGSSVSEDSQCADDSLSAESSSDSLSQDSQRSSKRKKKKNRDNTEHSLIADGSETSDLGSSGSEDAPSIDDWNSSPSPSSPTVGFYDVAEATLNISSKPESALELLEGEVLAEAEREKSFTIIESVPEEKLDFANDDSTDCEDSSVQAINSSIVEVCRSKDEIDEANIIDDSTDGSSENFEAPPAIRHSVIIELKDSGSKDEVEAKDTTSELKRSGSLSVSEADQALRKNKTNSKKKKNRRMSETGLGVCVGVTHNSKTNTKEFFEVAKKETNQIIEISEDGSWGLKEEKSKQQETAVSQQTAQGKVKISKTAKAKTGKMDSAEVIAAPPDGFTSNDGTDGVFVASCVSLNSEPSSLASVGNEVTVSDTNDRNKSSSPGSPDSQGKRKAPFWEDPLEETVQIKENSKSNLGVAIMESYDREYNKKKESLNLPDVSMMDFGHSAFDLERDRKNVIKQMIVKTKKKQSWYGSYATDVDATAPTVPSLATLKRSNSMSSVAKPANGLVQKSAQDSSKKQNFLLMKNSAERPQSTSDEEDIVFPSFMDGADSAKEGSSKEGSMESFPEIEPIPSIELTIKKLGIDPTAPPTPFKLNKHLTTITPFKPPSQNKHSRIKNVKVQFLNESASAEETAKSDDIDQSPQKTTPDVVALTEKVEEITVSPVEISIQPESSDLSTGKSITGIALEQNNEEIAAEEKHESKSETLVVASQNATEVEAARDETKVVENVVSSVVEIIETPAAPKNKGKK